MDAALGILLRADFSAVGGDAADIPFSVPEDAFTGFRDGLAEFFIARRIDRTPKAIDQLHKIVQCPNMQKTYHGTFAAAEIQAVVPIGAQTLADPVRPHLSGREIKNAHQMPVDRLLAAVSIGHRLVEEGKFTRLLDILYNSRDEPERIVRACVL